MKTPTEYLMSKLVQFNNRAEAQAIEDYADFLKAVSESDLKESDKKIIEDTINEIIADELNHQEKLQVLFTMLTDIEPNKD